MNAPLSVDTLQYCNVTPFLILVAVLTIEDGIVGNKQLSDAPVNRNVGSGLIKNILSTVNEKTIKYNIIIIHCTYKWKIQPSQHY